ncbi:hypothetical protein Tco_0005680 [Tanacetum coccineum]
MPKYAKFMKDLVTNKIKLKDTSRITLNEICSTTLLNRIPLKERDPGSSTIPCIISGLTIEKALTDLGASISLMPYSMFSRLELGKLKPTRMCIEITNKMTQYPKGIARNVLVKIDKFVFLVDFVILDMKEDSKVPIILGRPFLANAHAMIDVFNKKISLEVGNETITFDIEKSMKYAASTDDTCHYFDRPRANETGSVNMWDEEKDLESEEENKDIKEEKYLRRNKVETFTPYVESDKEDWEIFSNKKRNPLRRKYNNQGKTTPEAKRIAISLRICILRWKLNDATKKDHFLLPFIDQMLERLLGHKISSSEIEVDKAEVDVVAKLPYLTSVKVVRKLEELDEKTIKDSFPDEHLLVVQVKESEMEPWAKP